MSKQSLKQKGLTPTHCANLYLRYCLEKLPYSADAFQEVADIAPLNASQYKAVQKALRSRLARFIEKLDKSLLKSTQKGNAAGSVQSGTVKLGDDPDAI